MDEKYPNENNQTSCSLFLGEGYLSSGDVMREMMLLRDEDDVFGELVANSMKKMEDSVEKDELKIQIQTSILQMKKQLMA